MVGYFKSLWTQLLTYTAAGPPLGKVFGTQTSVYTASFSDDYRLILNRNAEGIPSHTMGGTIGSFRPNGISWFFNLNGSGIHMDTACSGSLATVDQACPGLWSGVADMVNQHVRNS